MRLLFRGKRFQSHAKLKLSRSPVKLQGWDSAPAIESWRQLIPAQQIGRKDGSEVEMERK
jgi:hypothetical protein